MAREAEAVPEPREAETEFIKIVLSPSTRGHLVDFSRRQVSWLADLAPYPAFPKQPLQWHLRRATAYSCGGSNGIGQ